MKDERQDAKYRCTQTIKLYIIYIMFSATGVEEPTP